MIHAILTSVIINQLLEKISLCHDLIVFFFVFYYFSHTNITATHKIQARYFVACLLVTLLHQSFITFTTGGKIQISIRKDNIRSNMNALR